MSTLGIAAGLATAGLWTATAVCFESSSRHLGSFSVNVLRLLVACALFFALSLARTGALVPVGVSSAMWCQLIVSGLTGFVIGDLLLFEAFVLIGARLSMLIYASVPSMTALAAFLFLDEAITGRGVLGMLVTLLGITTAILGGKNRTLVAAGRERRRGVVFAIGGSAGQAAGLLFGKSGSAGLDAFAATEVRVIAGLAGFLAFAMVTRRIGEIVAVLGRAFRPAVPSNATLQRDPRMLRRALGVMFCGAVLGPFLGVSLGLKSVQLLPAGVASTLMSIVPALLVPVSVFILRERVRVMELLGTAVTLVGVTILSL